MSFSLSSLLNPEPAQTEPHRSPEQQRKSSLPPIQYVQSREQHDATLPQALSGQQHFSYPPATAQEAAQALANLAASDIPPPTYYYGYSAPGYESEVVRSSSIDHRSSSSHDAPIELPPPTPTARKPSSPTLEQYQVASRSPEQRRPSMISSARSGFTLPPIQRITPPQQEQARRASVVMGSSVGHQDSYGVQSQIKQPSPESMRAPVNGGMAMGPHAEQAPPVAQTTHTAPRNGERSEVAENAGQLDGTSSSPPPVKQEAAATPGASSPIEARRSSIQYADMSGQTPKAVAALKQEHSVSTQSPLRESSVPMPSTEMPAHESANSKKRAAPSKTKKGTATTSKKAPPSKKRKVELKRSETPASRASKVPTLKTGSSMGTPANSSPAPSTRSYSGEPDDEPYGEDGDLDDDADADADGDLYCICRKPDNGTFMIGCDGTCDDWFHGKCVGIEERDKNLIDKYLCPNCTKAGRGRTTWKRMCRRHGCRQPARVGKSKGGKDGSKYCSEECGVLYFREMVARTRNREDTVRSRGVRMKGDLAGSDRAGMSDDDLGAKGGSLAAGEVKSLINVSKSADDFKKLGEGVLSPPATPDGKQQHNHTVDCTDAETAALATIHEQKEVARRRHKLLKDRMKFVTMTKQAASRTATEKELKPKEYCGYDPRLEWTEGEFAAWRDSSAGNRAFDLETLAVENSGGKTADKHEKVNGITAVGGDDDDDDDDHEGIYAQLSICDRKKCARHLEWSKLAVDDLRFEMSDNSDKMRALDKEEREKRERAALRAKAGGNINGEGSVEVHGLGITNGGTGEGEVEMGGVGDGEGSAATATAVMPGVEAETESGVEQEQSPAHEAVAD